MYHLDSGFDRIVDVAVVGFGDAGAVTAMTAHDLGDDVLIIEKQAEDRRRPNSRFSGGIFINPSDADAAEHYMRELYRINDELYETDPAVIRVWAQETALNAEWLSERGGTSEKIVSGGEHRLVEGFESIDLYRPTMNDHPGGTGHNGMGWGLFKFLVDEVAKRGISTMYGTSAKWLLTDATGAVIGIQVQDGDRVMNIGTSKGVVLTCGGFEFNPWLKWNNLRVNPTHFYGNPENVGDGIFIAQEVGAELWHMNSCAGRVVGYFPDSGYPGGVMIDIWGNDEKGGIAAPIHMAAGALEDADSVQLPGMATEYNFKPSELPGALFVDRHGRRFTNEVYRTHTLYYELANLDSHRLEYPKVPSWWIFDDRRMVKGPASPNYVGPAGPLREVAWSPDNLAEVERGWIISGATAGELAAKCNMDKDLFERSLTRYNEICAQGEDPDHGRPSSTLTPLDGTTLYAVQLWPGGPNTQGGPRRNADSQVMRVNGEPIPGLYSAGELGSIYGMIYPSGGGNIAECLAFGRVAGRNVSLRSRSARSSRIG